MSAHRIYCYGPQRDAVVDFMDHQLGAIISRDSPHAVYDAEQLRGLEHITFAIVDNHAHIVPQAMWEVIVRQGAIVMHIDDQYMRERKGILHRAAALFTSKADHGRVPLKHYPGDGA